jgi:hypothetical protein
VSDAFPGWGEVHIDLADGSVAQVFDKAPVFAAEDRRLRKDSAYPVPLTLDCDVSRIRTEAGTVRATLRRGLSDPTGLATFLVREHDVLPDN